MRKNCILLLSLLLFSTVKAQILTTGSTPIPAPESGTLPFNNGPFRPASFTYQTKSNFKLITGNNTLYTNGQDVYVTFDTSTLQGIVSTTGTANNITIFKASVILLYDDNFDGEFEFTNQLTTANTTYFIDGGIYFLNEIAYTSFAPGNTAVIGLTSPSGPNPVIFKQKPVLKGNSNGTITGRYLQRQLILGNSFLMNLIFDADGYGMVADNPTCSSANRYCTSYIRDYKDDESNIAWVTSGKPWSSNRGTSFFLISVTQPVFIRNIVIKNIGTADVSSGNFAINIIGNSSGQINIEDVIIDNCRGASSDSYRLIQVNASQNVNFKNLTFIQGTNGLLRDPVWIENPGTATIPADQLPNEDIRFAGDITFSGYSGKQRIGVQQTSYGNVTVPPSFRYAVFSVGTTSSVLGGSSQADILIYKSLTDFTQTWGASNNEKKVVFDLLDSCWLVRPTGTGVVPTVDQQLTGINTVLVRMSSAFNPSGSTSQNGRGLITNANIKIVADADGYVPANFTTVPVFNIASARPNIHIRMVQSETTLWRDAISVATIVPIRPAHQITLNGTTSSTASTPIKLYGIDFNELAQTTLHEATGLTNATLYNSASLPAPSTNVVNAKILNAQANNFSACKFTGLLGQLSLTSPAISAGSTIAYDPLVVTSITATVSADQVYTSSSMLGVPATNFTANDSRYVWTSSDTAIATITQGGVITLNGMLGTTTISACALDTLNQGEIIKPCVNFVLDAKSACGGVTDLDGNTYVSIKIDTLCWFVSNLQSLHYDLSGNEIPISSIYNANPLNNDTVYNLNNFGRLYDRESAYNGGATPQQGVCPQGWRLPTPEEWESLNSFPSAELKKPGPNYWLGEPVNNASGLSLVPGGYYNGQYVNLFGDGYYWAFDPAKPNQANACHIFFNCSSSTIVEPAENVRMSVRCVTKAQ